MNKILEQLADRFELIVRNEYHVQIKVNERNYHNFWPMKDGGVKVCLCGSRETFVSYNGDKLIKQLSAFRYSDTAVAEFRRLLIKTNGKDGVWCDAGFKINGEYGKSKMAVIRKIGENIDVIVRVSDTLHSNIEAEITAIRIAKDAFPDATDIFSDCLPAVEEFNKVNETDVAKWIKRSDNKKADRVANLRR